MGFFSDRIGDELDDGLVEEVEPVRDPERPEWLGPPARTMPGISSQVATIFKTSDAMLVVRGFEAYATGVQLTLELWVRDDHSPINLHEWFGQRGTAPVATMLWFGVTLADGSAWTNVDPLDRPDDYSWFGESSPHQPTLTPQGGGGTAGPRGDEILAVATASQRFCDIRCRMAIWHPESAAVIDGAELRQVAEDASLIWE